MVLSATVSPVTRPLLAALVLTVLPEAFLPPTVLLPAAALPRFLLVPDIPASILPKDSENTSTS